FLELRDDCLKRLEDKGRFVLSLAGMSDGRALCFPNQLAVGSEQSAHQPGDANKTNEQRNDECCQQEWPIDHCSAGGQRKHGKDGDRAEQEKSGNDGQQNLETAGVHSISETATRTT